MSISYKHVLLVEDHRGLSSALTDWFANQQSLVIHTLTTAREALGFISRKHVDVAVIDLTATPEVRPRLAAIRTWRDAGLHFPILATSANDYDGLVEQSFDAGADDFLRKPYPFGDLRARIDRVLTKNRYSLRSAIRVDGIPLLETTFSFAGATITPDFRILFPNGKSTKLGAKHLGILREFSNHRGKLLPKEKLVYAVWGADANLNSTSVHQYLHVLRKIYRTGEIELEHFVHPESKIGWRITEEETSANPVCL